MTGNGRNELFVTSPAAGLEPIKVGGTFSTREWLAGPTWSPDGTRLAFRTNSRLLVASAAGGGEAVNVSGTMVSGGRVWNFAWSPNGTHLAFRADKERHFVWELYVASAAGGGEPVKVSGSLVPDGDVSHDQFAWSPDGTRLAFIADKDADNVRELYVTLPAGVGEPVKISGALVADGDVIELAWSPLGNRTGSP